MIVLFIGPMFAGKSTNLLGYERRFRIANKKYILINHSSDIRYSLNGRITTHDGCSGSERSISGRNIEMIEHLIDKGQYDGIIVDEAQFFEDLPRYAEKWSSEGKTVVCAGLSGDFRKKTFPVISEMISIADKIIHLTATCGECGGDASFTKRISEEVEVNVVGGIDKYHPRCGKCF